MVTVRMLSAKDKCEVIALGANRDVPAVNGYWRQVERKWRRWSS